MGQLQSQVSQPMLRTAPPISRIGRVGPITTFARRDMRLQVGDCLTCRERGGEGGEEEEQEEGLAVLRECGRWRGRGR